MQSKTIQLNSLFDKWEQTVSEYKGKFVRDGIINENLYQIASTKILFITKEPNNPKEEAGDFRIWWDGKVKYSFSLRIGTWAYGILNEFKPINDITTKDIIESLSRISFMNLKKIGGKGTSSKSTIIKHTKQNIQFLRQEINIIDPKIIVLGLSKWNELRSLLFNDQELKVIDHYIHSYGKRIIINFFHPSARGKGITNKFLYEELEKKIITIRNRGYLP